MPSLPPTDLAARPAEKRCTTCGLLKPLDAYYTTATTRDGRVSACKDCYRAARQAQAPVRPAPAQKACSRCQLVKPAGDFARNKRSPDGINWACKACVRAYAQSVVPRPPAQPDKRCRRCGLDKPLEDFYPNKRTLVGRTVYCRACMRAYESSPDARRRRRLRMQGQPSEERERRLRALRADYRRYRERRLASVRAYYMLHREAIADYRRTHRAALYALHRAWVERNRERWRDLQRTGSLNRRARAACAGGRFRAADLAAMRVRQQGCCAYCGATLGAAGHVEHRIPLSRGGSNWPANLALACRDCNQSKFTKTDAEFLAWRRTRGLPVAGEAAALQVII